MNLVASLVQTTQYAVQSDIRPLRRNVASLFRTLRELDAELRELRRVLQMRQSRSNLNTGSISNDTDDSASTTSEVFFACVERFSSSNSAESSVDRLDRNFSGSAEYYLEMMPSYFAEQYTGHSFDKAMFFYKILRSSENPQVVEFYIGYAETPRRWHQLIIRATFQNISDQPIPSGSRGSATTVSEELNDLLKSLVLSTRFHGTATSFDLMLTKNEEGRLVANTQDLNILEHLENSSISNEELFLQDLDDLNCKKYKEQEIVMKSRRAYTNTCIVGLKATTCIMHRIPFADKTSKAADQRFFKDIKLLRSLGNCPGIARLIGIVLDDSAQHVKGYLTETPQFPSLARFLYLASKDKVVINTSIRKAWAKQAIQIVSTWHRRGIVMEILELSFFSIRPDGTLIFIMSDKRPEKILESPGYHPPELRSEDWSSSVLHPKLNYRTDIYQLGIILWLIAQQKPWLVGSTCAIAACSTPDHLMCTANHYQPVELPPVSAEGFERLDRIIEECRLHIPRLRPPAHALIPRLSSLDYEVPQTSIDELYARYSPAFHEPFYSYVCCSKCGDPTTEDHYHCKLCDEGDFDTCLRCYSNGLRCYHPDTHQLTRRVLNGSDFIEQCV